MIPAASMCVSVKITARASSAVSGGRYQSWVDGKIVDETHIATGVNHSDADGVSVLR